MEAELLLLISEIIKCQHIPRTFSSFNRKQCVKLALSAGSDPEVCFANNKVLFEGLPAQHNSHLSIHWSLLSCPCAITFFGMKSLWSATWFLYIDRQSSLCQECIYPRPWWSNHPIIIWKICTWATGPEVRSSFKIFLIFILGGGPVTPESGNES